MADYSGYKIKRPHSLTPLTSVYEAEAVDGRPGRFALKIFHPPASTNVRRVHAIEGWLLAAERQQQSAKKDGTVLEVLAFGRCEEGAFAVYPWQEHFLEPWIKTLGAKGNTLRALAECLLNSIEKWEKETGGPHGNLKPSNIFPDRTGPLVGMTAKLSDPAFLPGAKPEALQLADLAAVGAMLATIVRRRVPGAWPIEEAPEWKALGNGGKGWLDYCNYLMNPQPAEGELTLAKARLRLKKVPKDANPAKTAAFSLAAVLVLSGVGLVGFARFGDPSYMPDRIERLAIKLGNPKTLRDRITPSWALLCMAWDSWLLDLQSNGKRLLRTDGLLAPTDPLRKEIQGFLDTASTLRPEALLSEVPAEKRLGVLAKSPPPEVLEDLLTNRIATRVEETWTSVKEIGNSLEGWPRWEQLRELQRKLNERNFTQVAGALGPKLPLAPGSEGYRRDEAKTLKLLNDISLDSGGTLPLASRWSEISEISTAMTATADRVQKEMPRVILNRLEDKPSVGDFADSLVSPLEEMRLRRKQYGDPQVVRERFLAESPLQTETAEVTADDIPKWENELKDFTLVPKTPAEDPRLDPFFENNTKLMAQDAVDLELEAPDGEANQPATLNTESFKRESDALAASLKSLRERVIVKRDVPKVTEEKDKLAGVFGQLIERLKYTLTLLDPKTWLAKVAPPYGTLDESQRRWAAWKQEALPPSVTAESLKGPLNRTKFRLLREDERKVKEWINGLEGPEGFGALKVPDLAGTASTDTAAELKRLEGMLRQRAATAVGAATQWPKALPATPWNRATAAMRLPLENHSQWLGQIAYFAGNLDKLSEYLTDGMEWKEGVSEMFFLLEPRIGVEELAGPPGGWYKEAKELRQLNDASDLATLKAAVQSGGLSGKLMAWRKLGLLGGWPAGVADFDLDSAVIKRMRELVGHSVKDPERRTSLLEEMVKGTRERFNRAALVAARAEAQLTDMFNRMPGAGVTEADLIPKVAYNLQVWRLKRTDLNDKDLDRLGANRDAFVNSVRAIGGGEVAALPEVDELLKELAKIELKNDPNRKPTDTPATKGWGEEPINEGFGLIATWRGPGARSVPLRLEYTIVEPEDGSPPFYLANRVISVGEFVELMNGRPADAEAVRAALSDWMQKETTKPYALPVGWYPRDGTNFKVLEVSSAWIPVPGSLVGGLLSNKDLYPTVPELKQAVEETPKAKSPLQQVTQNAAKAFTEKMLGARLPTVKEWRAVLQKTGASAATGHVRGANFQKLFDFVRDFKVEGDSWGPWRPNNGIYLPTGFKDDGRAGATAEGGQIWFRDVDIGPKSGEFINLTGNVSIFLAGQNANEFYVAGGSVLSPPGIDFTQPQKVVAGGGMIGVSATTGKVAFSDVGIRPAFDAPPGFKERYRLLVLVRGQRYLTL